MKKLLELYFAVTEIASPGTTWTLERATDYLNTAVQNREGEDLLERLQAGTIPFYDNETSLRAKDTTVYVAGSPAWKRNLMTDIEQNPRGKTNELLFRVYGSNSAEETWKDWEQDEQEVVIPKRQTRKRTTKK